MQNKANSPQNPVAISQKICLLDLLCDLLNWLGLHLTEASLGGGIHGPSFRAKKTTQHQVITPERKAILIIPVLLCGIHKYGNMKYGYIKYSAT